jgi:Zn-dependent peptidase ImmA (M78 family)
VFSQRKDKPVKKFFNSIEMLVDKIVRENSFTDIPINAESVAEIYGISVVHYIFTEEYKNVRSLFRSDRKIIYINDKLELAWKNFIIAHELGHYLLGHIERDDYKPCYTCPINADDLSDMDREANHFTVCLLIHEKVVSAIENCILIQRHSILHKFAESLMTQYEIEVGY